jgi:glutathione synthase/RimK-type ligase-like ATP-grasp enzyme
MYQLVRALETDGLLYLQEFIPTEPVRDLRIDIVAEQIICSFFRNNRRNEEYPVCNISRGGVQEHTTVPAEIASEARRLMKLSGLTVAGIDLIWNQKTKRYEWVEVNPEPNAAAWQPELAVAIANSLIAQALKRKSRTDTL